MAFIHTGIAIAGVSAASLPIIIHLLNRTRYRPRPWAAMQFLLESLRRNRRRLQIEELILLALRVLVVALLAVMLGRFVGCSGLDILPGTYKNNQVVFLLDDSLSTGQKGPSASVFGSASGDLAAMIERITAESGGTRIGILRTSDVGTGKWFASMGPIEDPAARLAAVRALHPTDTRNDLADALAEAARAFPDDKTAKDLLVLGDFRRIDLADKDASRRIAAALKELAERGVRITAVDYGRQPESNLTVETIELLNRFVLTEGPGRQPARIQLTVRNNGAVSVQDVKVELQAVTVEEDRLVSLALPARRVERIDPGQAAALELPYWPSRPGRVAIVASLPGDELPGDNVGHIVLDVKPFVRFLVVDGSADPTDRTAGEALYFAGPIDPTGDGAYGARAEVIDPRGLDSVRFEDYAGVALLNVRAFPASADGANGETWPAAAALEQYVRRGGGLVIFTGPNVASEFYNKRLYADGAGLLPLPIARRPQDEFAGRRFVRLDPKSIRDEAPMNVFSRTLREGVDISRLIRFFTITPAIAAEPQSVPDYVRPPRVLARFNDKDRSPAIVMRPYGAGRVLAVYTSVGPRWSDWATDPEGTNVAFLQDAVRALARKQQGLTGRVGEPIAHELPSALEAPRVSLRTPGYPAAEIVPLQPQTQLAALQTRIDALAARADADNGDEVQLAEGLRRALADAVTSMQGRDLVTARRKLVEARRALGRSDTPRWALQAHGDISALLAREPEALAARQVQHARTADAGLYVLTISEAGGDTEDVLLARNVDPLEGRLAHGGAADVEQVFGDYAGEFRYEKRIETGPAGNLKLRPELEWWTWAAAAVLVLMLVEMFLARRFGHWPARPVDGPQ